MASRTKASAAASLTAGPFRDRRTRGTTTKDGGRSRLRWGGGLRRCRSRHSPSRPLAEGSGTVQGLWSRSRGRSSWLRPDDHGGGGGGDHRDRDHDEEDVKRAVAAHDASLRTWSIPMGSGAGSRCCRVSMARQIRNVLETPRSFACSVSHASCSAGSRRCMDVLVMAVDYGRYCQSGKG